MSAGPDLDDFTAEATAFLDEHLERRSAGDRDDEMVWGKGELDVSVFHALSEDDERALLQRVQAWTQTKAERGYHATTTRDIAGRAGTTRSTGPPSSAVSACPAPTPAPMAASSAATRRRLATRPTASPPA